QALVSITVPEAATVDIGADVALDGSGSRFADDFSWSLERCDSAVSVIAQCRSAEPPAPPAAGGAIDLTCAAASESVVGASSPLASFTTQATGIYRATLAINGGAGTASGLLPVPDWRPCALNAGVVDL